MKTALAALCLALAGCAGGLSQYPGTPPVEPLMIAESDAGKTVDIERGRKLTLRLEANRSTGYRWSVASSGEALTQLGEPFYTSEKPEAGAAGTEYWSFTPVRAGRQELRFEYRRPWERDKPAAKVLTYTFNVH